jgi:class 3 adenylate cyclase
MAAEVRKEIELEIAHVLFLDIVGYSKLSVNEQHARVEELNEIVRLSDQFRNAEAASRLLKIPTGDGMPLVFYKSPEETARCALEISRALKDNARLQVRMGIHSFQISLPPMRKRAEYVPEGAYLTRSCTAVGCQTFSSDALTHALPSVQDCSNKCGRGSRRGADTPLRKRQNNANYRACAPVGSKMMPLEASKVAV